MDRGEADIRVRVNEEDALERLTNAVTVVSQQPPVSRPPVDEHERGVAEAALPRINISATGEAPNILSKPARHRLVRDTQQVGLSLFIGAFALAVVVPLVDVVLDAATEDVSVPDVWVVPVVGFIVAAVLLYLIAYFTVMGFGKVSIGVRSGEGGKDADT
jgi:hypothetical protein